jgi:hypothetical protein
MLYVSKNARRARWPISRTWLAVGYAVVGVAVVIAMVVACQAQADRIDESLSGALSSPTATALAPAPAPAPSAGTGR